MPARTRTQRRNRYGSYRASVLASVVEVQYPDIDRVCEDFVGNPHGNNAFNSTRGFAEGAWCSGHRGDRIYIDAPANNFSALAPAPKYINPSKPAAQEVNRAIAITNPSRPEILLPAFIGELGDLPRMLKYGAEVAAFLTSPQFRRDVTGSHRFKPDYMQAGTLVHYLKPTRGNAINIAKQTAVANLAIQFGYLPFFGDIAKMLLLQDAVEKRRKEIDRLHAGNGLQRRVTLFNHSTDVVENIILSTPVATARRDVQFNRTTRQWATVRWKPFGPSTLPPSDETIRQNMLGLNLQSVASVAWELLPWSWMADYFGNVGHTLAALNNSMLTAPPKGCVMTESSERAVFAGFPYGSPPDFWISGGKRKLVRKLRYPFVGVQQPSFGIPILGDRQLSILGSIITTRAFR